MRVFSGIPPSAVGSQAPNAQREIRKLRYPAQMKLINSGESLVTAFLTTPRPVRCIIDGLG